MGEITVATSEQSDGIAQVNDAIGQLDQMTQKNAASVEQSAAAASSMKDQAHRLSGLVATFKLGNPTAAMPARAPVLPKPVLSRLTPAPKAMLVAPRAVGMSAKANAHKGEDDWENF